MAAPVRITGGKIVFQKSHFDHPKSQHLKCITDHWFNAAIDVTIPDSTSLPAVGLLDNIEHFVNSERYSYMLDVPVATLIREEFIEAFVKRGQVYILSKGRIDGEDCLCVIPTGHLILNLTKDTYETLGLEGKPSQYNEKWVKKYVVTLELLAEHFKPGRKNYVRAKTCLESWGAKFDCYVQWNPNADDICPSSLQTYLSQFGNPDGRVEKRSHEHTELKFPESLVPVISADDHEGEEDDHVTWEDFYDWLGCRACGVSEEGQPGDYVNSCATPEPNAQFRCVSIHRYTGFLSCPTISSVFDHLRENLTSSKLPWIALTTHGFQDAPVSWKQKEHGYLKSGDNFYTFILFPDRSYWLIQGVGGYDICP